MQLLHRVFLKMMRMMMMVVVVMMMTRTENELEWPSDENLSRTDYTFGDAYVSK